MKKIDYWKLAVSLFVCQLAGIVGSIFTSPAIPTWYAGLNSPSFNPPNWVFSPVWISLFVLMGIALYLVWEKGLKTRTAKNAVTVFGIQLALNTLWSVLFFGLKSPLYAFIEILFLWGAILMSIVFFYRISKPAAYLLIPYLLWVSFATVLNAAYVLLN